MMLESFGFTSEIQSSDNETFVEITGGPKQESPVPSMASTSSTSSIRKLMGMETRISDVLSSLEITTDSTLSNTDGNLVGMETRIRNVLSSLDIGTKDVRMIGIKGMGGGGKTTLARAVYDQISNQFEGKSFVENVRELSKPTSPGLKKLQTKILEDVLNRKDITFNSVHDGKNMLKDMMSRRKTLVVLDDVDRIDQLEALAGEPDWFKAGSRIIITTRDEQVLLAHRVNFVHDVNLLSSMEAICLFSRYAFKRDIPTQGYAELSGQVVQYAHGLPLTIKVLGSFLFGQSENFWIATIERLKTIPFKDTMDRLEISFDGLEDDYKEIFLDVACILKGWPKVDAITALESRGFNAKFGLRVLEQKSLITYNEDGELWMHDHLQEMGRNIVRRSHPGEPQRHSRLWVKEEIEDILTNDLGTQATKCLYFWSSPGFSAEIAMKGLAKMKDLRFIHIEDYFDNNIDEFDKVSEYLPSSLRFMRLWGFPFSSLPNTFQAKYLVGLDIRGSNIVQLWEDGEGKVLHKLRFLNLSDSKLRTLDLGLTPNLEYLDLENCYDLVEINAPIGCLKKLDFLDLSDCRRFESFVFDKRSQRAKADSLSELHLIAEPTYVCPLHSDNVSPKFRFSCYYKEDPASSFGNLERLISLGLCPCTNLESFSRSICSLQGLRKLTLRGGIPEVPRELDQLECLEELIFSSTKIRILPDSICMLKHLKSLELKSSFLLEKLPDDLGRLESLEKLILTHCKLLQNIPSSICKMKCINELHLRGCTRVVELPEDIGCLEGLKELNIVGTGITRLPQSIFQLRGLCIFVGSMQLLDTSGLLIKRRITYYYYDDHDDDDDDEIVYSVDDGEPIII